MDENKMSKRKRPIKETQKEQNDNQTSKLTNFFAKGTISKKREVNEIFIILTAYTQNEIALL